MKKIKAFLIGAAILLVIHCIVGVLLFYAALTDNSQLIKTLAMITNIMALISTILAICTSFFLIFVIFKAMRDD